MRRRSYINELTARATEASLAADVVDSGQPLTPAAEVEREYEGSIRFEESSTWDPARQMGIVATQREYATRALDDLRRQKQECETTIAASEKARDEGLQAIHEQRLKAEAAAQVELSNALATAQSKYAKASALAHDAAVRDTALTETTHADTVRKERARLREITAGTEGLELLLGRLRQTE